MGCQIEFQLTRQNVASLMPGGMPDGPSGRTSERMPGRMLECQGGVSFFSSSAVLLLFLSLSSLCFYIFSASSGLSASLLFRDSACLLFWFSVSLLFCVYYCNRNLCTIRAAHHRARQYTGGKQTNKITITTAKQQRWKF